MSSSAPTPRMPEELRDAATRHASANAPREHFDPTEEERHWNEKYSERPYVDSAYTFDDYGPAFRYGGQSWTLRADRRASFDDAEHDLRDGWERAKAQSRLTWEKAREAVRDGWDRLEQRFGRDDLRADDDGMALDPRRAQKKGPKPSDEREGTKPVL